MQVHYFATWRGGIVRIPQKFISSDPIEVSWEEVQALIAEYDVAFMHIPQPQPSKKERGRGAKPVPHKIMLAVDVKGYGFKQR